MRSRYFWVLLLGGGFNLNFFRGNYCLASWIGLVSVGSTDCPEVAAGGGTSISGSQVPLIRFLRLQAGGRVRSGVRRNNEFQSRQPVLNGSVSFSLSGGEAQILKGLSLSTWTWSDLAFFCPGWAKQELKLGGFWFSGLWSWVRRIRGKGTRSSRTVVGLQKAWELVNKR